MKQILRSIALLLFLGLIFLKVSEAQVPPIVWQKDIGSIGYDPLADIVQSTDGYYYTGCGNYEDAGGDKPFEPLGYASDYWVLKLASNGDIVWQKIIGGSRGDGYRALFATDDGGVVIGGSSASPAGLDKTENVYLNGMGEYTSDYWIVKLDANGNIDWQNDIGGKGDDIVADIEQTIDGGYIIGGYSTSSLSGDKTEINIGSYAYWIVKLDALGNIEWQNTIDGIHEEFLASIHQTADGGYIVGGKSRSGISGEKTEACFSDSYDYWILKLDTSGNIEWQNTIGGNNDEELNNVIQTSDGGYLVCGSSESNATGDKTENKKGADDFWILKLNTAGNIVWQNTIGGSGIETHPDIWEDPAGGYFLAGSSETNYSADKTEPSYGNWDYWLMKLDNSGNILWQDVYGGSGYDRFTKLLIAQDGGLLLSGFSTSDISGNKTQNCIPTTYDTPSDDLWIIKLEGTSCIPVGEVCNGLDDDCNGIVDNDADLSAVIAATGDIDFCKGSSVPLYVTYTGNATLNWIRNGSIIPDADFTTYIATTSGTYSCRVTTDCGWIYSNSIHVSVHKNPHASVTALGPVVFCAGGSVTLQANAGGGLMYQWIKNGVDITGETAITYVATTAGVYTCRVTKAATGCQKTSNPVTVTVPCRESEFISTDRVVVYPNPAENVLHLHTNLNIEAIATVYDLQGQKVSEKNFVQDATLDIAALAPGMYVIILRTDYDMERVQFIKE